MKQLGTVKLSTQRLLLRPFENDDANDMFLNWTNDQENCQYMSWPVHENIEVTKMILNRWVHSYFDNSFYQWAIVLKGKQDIVIGSISLVNVNSEKCDAEIGFCLSKKYQKRGYMSEAVKAIIDFAFNELELDMIYGETMLENVPSQHIFEKLGFTYVKNVVCVFPLRGISATCKRFELTK